MLDPLSLNIPLASSVPSRPFYPTRKLLSPSPDHPDDYVLEIDYSSMSNFLNCARQSENYSIRSREANKDNSPTDFGKLFHTLEETRRLSGYNDEIKAKQMTQIADHFVSHVVSPSDHRTSDRMVNVLKLYYEKYAKDGVEGKIYRDANGPFVERPFKVELCTIPINGKIPYDRYEILSFVRPDIADVNIGEVAIRNLHILYTGRIDMVISEGGALWVWDDKTTSRGGKEFEDAFRLSLQTKGYCWAVWKLLSTAPMGCIVNAVIIRPLTKTGTGTEFNRHNYFYSPDVLIEWELNMKAHVSDFVSCLVRGYFPQTSLSFKSPCAMCDYAENCALPREQRGADLASDLFRDVTWNPIN